jgi:hypothetical protein
MSSQPNPARLAEYRTHLAELLAARDQYRAQHDHHKARLLNRQIRAQIKWIRAAELAATDLLA